MWKRCNIDSHVFRRFICITRISPVNMNSTYHKTIRMGFIALVIAALALVGFCGDRAESSAAEDSVKAAGSSMAASAGTCPENPSALIGTWIKTSPVSTQTNTFTSCEASVSKSNGCSATFSYEVSGRVLTNTLLTARPSRCGTVGAVSRHTYSISGNTLTIGSTVFTRQ